PYVHGNLAVFLIHGPDAAPGRSFLTLEEALAAKKAVVRETGSVNELAIENVSAEDDVYVQAGDIVRGGRQDRTIPWDTVVERGDSPVSASSMELALENEKVRGSADEYVRALEAVVAARPDAIGYAFAIDGKVNSADVYASAALFKKLWPKLLRASAVEAIAK